LKSLSVREISAAERTIPRSRKWRDPYLAVAHDRKSDLAARLQQESIEQSDNAGQTELFHATVVAQIEEGRYILTLVAVVI